MQSIRLSQLNSDLREKVQKFDTLNDGELSLQEALQAIVTLQKQSNNYKKTVYLLIPVLILTLAAMFGINILSIQLTKDMTVTNTASSSPAITTVNNRVLQTLPYTDSLDFFEVLSNGDPTLLYSISHLEMDGLYVPVQGVFIEGLTNTTTSVMISNPYVWFKIVSDGTYTVDYHLWVNPNDTFAQVVFHTINTKLQLSVTEVYLNKQSKQVSKIRDDKKEVKVTIKTDHKPQTRGIGGFGCGRKCFG